MTLGILFENGCTANVSARYSHILKMPYTTLSVLQRYIDGHGGVDWLSKVESGRDLAQMIVCAESRMAVVDGVWNESGWQEDASFFDGRVVKEIPFFDLDWNFS